MQVWSYNDRIFILQSVIQIQLTQLIDNTSTLDVGTKLVGSGVCICLFEVLFGFVLFILFLVAGGKVTMVKIKYVVWVVVFQ